MQLLHEDISSLTSWAAIQNKPKPRSPIPYLDLGATSFFVLPLYSGLVVRLDVGVWESAFGSDHLSWHESLWRKGIYVTTSSEVRG